MQTGIKHNKRKKIAQSENLADKVLLEICWNYVEIVLHMKQWMRRISAKKSLNFVENLLNCFRNLSKFHLRYFCTIPQLTNYTMASSQFLFKRRLEIQAQRFAAEFWEVFLAVVIAWKKSLPGNKSSAVQRQYQYTVPFWFQYLTLMCYIHIYTHISFV